MIINDEFMIKLTQITAQILENEQNKLREIKWTNGESNLDTEYSLLASDCCKKAFIKLKKNNKNLKRIKLDVNIPDLICVFSNNKNEQIIKKIELKSSKTKIMLGSTIGKLNINQPFIFCLRPRNNTNKYKIRYSQYGLAMGESNIDRFQDRTPRPIINFDKMIQTNETLNYIHIDQKDWVNHYAECAVLRTKNRRCKTSWQDDLVNKIIEITKNDFIKNTTIDEFRELKRNIDN